MKHFYPIVALFLLGLVSCTHEPSPNASVSDTLSYQTNMADTLGLGIFDGDKWIALNGDTESENAFGYVPGKKKLEKRLEKEFSTIDPLEYYLSENNKFSDKKAMNKKREKIERLNKIYNSNYYDLGHIPERRNNANLMMSLTNTSYPLKSYASMGDDFAENKSMIEMKSGSKRFGNISTDDLKTLLNNAVQLINLSELPEAEETLNYIENTSLSKEYLLYYNKAFIRFQYSDFYQTINYARQAIKIRKDFYLGYLLMGDSYLALDLNQKAYEYYSKALDIKENIVSLERVSYSALRIGKADISESCYSKILEKYKGKDRINYMAGYALALTYNKKYEQADKAIEELKGVRKEWAIPFLIEGWNELLAGNYQTAEKAFSESDKKGEKLYSSIGKAIGYYCNKDYLSSSRLFYYLEENPKYKKLEKNPALLIYAGYSYANSLDFNSAMLKFIDYSAVVKKDACYYLGMSLCSFGFDDFNSAELYLDSAGIQTNNMSEYYYLKGIYALRNSKYKNAKAAFEKSLLCNNKNLWSINGLGASLKGLESYEKSISAFNTGLILNPNDPYLLFNKASAIFSIANKLHEKGAVKQAADTLKYGLSLMNKVSTIAPFFFTDMNIGNAYALIKDSTNALKYYSKVKNLAAEVNKGSLYAGMNLNNEARQIWEQVKATDTSFTLAKYNLEALDSYSSQLQGKKFKYYENYYFQVGYHWQISIPVLFETNFEPLVPLGYANLKFTKVSGKKDEEDE